MPIRLGLIAIAVYCYAVAQGAPDADLQHRDLIAAKIMELRQTDPDGKSTLLSRLEKENSRLEIRLREKGVHPRHYRANAKLIGPQILAI